MEDIVLIHHGIKGQKWGVRRFQNEDGTRTAAGKAREHNGEQGTISGSSQRKGLTDAQKSTLKKVAIGAGIAAAAGLAVYGAVKYSDAINNKDFLRTTELGKLKLQADRDFMQREFASELQKMADEGKINSFTVSNGHTTVRDARSEYAAQMKKYGLDKEEDRREQREKQDQWVRAQLQKEKESNNTVRDARSEYAAQMKKYGIDERGKQIREREERNREIDSMLRKDREVAARIQDSKKRFDDSPSVKEFKKKHRIT